MTIAGFFTPAWCPAWTAALINHLWQSTAVVLVAWLLTLLLRTRDPRADAQAQRVDQIRKTGQEKERLLMRTVEVKPY